MPKTRTLTDASLVFTALTGSDRPAADQHFRILREAGVLPSARTRLTDGILARFIVGMLCGTTHANAPKATLRALRAALVSFDGPDLPAPFKLGDTLGEVLTKLIFHARRGVRPLLFVPIVLGIDAGGDHAELIISCDGPEDRKWVFISSEPDADTTPEHVYPIVHKRALVSPVIDILAMLTSETVSELTPAAQRGLVAAP
jgi:hypothetical protein